MRVYAVVPLLSTRNCHNIVITYFPTQNKKKILKDPSLAQMLLFWFPPFLGRIWFPKNYTILSKVEEETDQFLMQGI